MKLEKVNDHQIRATLTKADLADRELKLSELAYGTEKAKNLFRDMMQQAAYEFGFEAEDIPLMIEAIPLSSECIVLIITKVEDPEELDARFSNFAPSVHEDEDSPLSDVLQAFSDEGENVLDLFRKLKANSSQEVPVQANTGAGTSEKLPDAAQLPYDFSFAFSFADLDTVIRVASLLEPIFFGPSSLYKNRRNGRLTLVISKGNHTPEDFNRVCNMICEYGTCERYSAASEAYINEHNETILKENALAKLLAI